MSARREHGGEDAQLDDGAPKRGDVTSELDRARSQTRVGGELILQFQVLYVREIRDLDAVRFRTNAAGFDEVVRVLVQPEKEEFESLASVRKHRKLVELSL